jgi:hypothetical protein
VKQGRFRRAKSPPPGRDLTPGEVARLFGCSTATASDWHDKGLCPGAWRLPPHKDGRPGHRRFPRADAIMDLAADRARAAHRARVRARKPAPPELPYGGFLSVADHAELMRRRVMYTQRRGAAR